MNLEIQDKNNSTVQLNKLIKICQYIGSMTPYWTQGKGSNVSCKIENVLWIKASGYRLDAVQNETDLATVDLNFFRKHFKSISGSENPEKEYAELIARSDLNLNKNQKRPSMETGFHAILPQKFIIHFHSIAALLMADEEKKNPGKVFSTIEKSIQLKMKYVRPESPGWKLSELIAKEDSIQVFILESHGVILACDDEKELEKWELAEKQFCIEWNYSKLLDLYQSKNPNFDAECTFPDNIPLKIYYPDTAVFVDKLKDILILGESNLFTFPECERNKNKDLYEIWLATRILISLQPDLEELIHEISDTVASLPTELFRRENK